MEANYNEYMANSPQLYRFYKEDKLSQLDESYEPFARDLLKVMLQVQLVNSEKTNKPINDYLWTTYLSQSLLEKK